MFSPRILRSRRRTIAIEVRSDGQVWVRTPLRTPKFQIEQILEAKNAWITKKLDQLKHGKAQRQPHAFQAGELLPYLGLWLPLQYSDQHASIHLTGEAIVLPSQYRSKAREALVAWYRSEARRICTALTTTLARQHNLSYAILRISSAQTRWGSCSSKHTLSFSWRLVMAPLKVIEYVVLHELAHLRVPNHSREFWKQLAEWQPDYETQRKWLKREGHALTLD